MASLVERAWIITRRSGSGAAGGRSSNVLETLRAATPRAIATESEKTAMRVSFQCLRRIRKDRIAGITMHYFATGAAHAEARYV